MAVVQISRIQHRRGRHDSLPEALAEAELAMATDTGEVFIGAPNTARVQHRRPGVLRQEGIYPFANIRLLTEHDVAYTLSDKVYYHGPLARHTVSNNIEHVNDKAVGVALTGPTAVIEDFFEDDQSGANVYFFKIDGLVQDVRAVSIRERDLVIDLGFLSLPSLAATAKISISYFPSAYFYEFRLDDSDAFIIDYSVGAGDAWPATGYDDVFKPRRVGTLMVVADPNNVNVRDDFVELNTDIPGQTNMTFSGRVINNGDGPRVILTCISQAAQQMQITFNVRRWSSK